MILRKSGFANPQTLSNLGERKGYQMIRISYTASIAALMGLIATSFIWQAFVSNPDWVAAAERGLWQAIAIGVIALVGKLAHYE